MLLLAWAAAGNFLPDRWATGAGLAVWLLPYMLFICLAAIISAGLNLVGRFAVAASTPILLNLSMIGALAAGLWLDADVARVVYWLCGGVLLGGLLQLLCPSDRSHASRMAPATGATGWGGADRTLATLFTGTNGGGNFAG